MNMTDATFDLDSLQPLLRASHATQLWGREEEIEIVRQAQSGDARAIERLLARNFGLVLHIANAYVHGGVAIADLVQEGMMGLRRAIDLYDLKRANQAQFATYGLWWARAYVRQAARRASVVPLPRRHRAGDAASRPRICYDMSLITDLPHGETPEHAVLASGIVGAIRQRIAKLSLSPMERRILEERLLVEGKKTTLAAIGKCFRRSRERVRQVEVLLQRRLRRILADVWREWKT